MTTVAQSAAVATNHPLTSGRHPSASCQIRFVDPISSSDEWDHLVGAHPDSHVFHGTAWARVLSNSYRHKPFYLLAFHGSEVAAAVPVMEVASPITGRRAVSLPFSDFCPPLLFSETAYEASIAALLDLGFTRGWRFLRMSDQPTVPQLQTTSPSLYAHQLHLNCSEDDLFARCASSVRRAIRKAQNEGVTVERASTRAALIRFYAFHCQTRRRHGLPPQPWKFFEHIYREIILPGNGVVFTAFKGPRPIAAAVFFSWQDQVLYKFSASDSSFQHLRPSNLVVWEAIRFFASQGARSLHFGRTDSVDEGLRRFKLGWGSTEEILHSRRFDFQERRWSSAKPVQAGIHNHVFRRLPLFVNRVAGAAIYPHLD